MSSGNGHPSVSPQHSDLNTADVTTMGDSAQIGYMPTRVWGCPTTAMWVHRIGPEQAKRMMFTGDKINGVEAARIGLVLKSVPDEELDLEVHLSPEPSKLAKQ